MGEFTPGDATDFAQEALDHNLQERRTYSADALFKESFKTLCKQLETKNAIFSLALALQQAGVLTRPVCKSALQKCNSDHTEQLLDFLKQWNKYELVSNVHSSGAGDIEIQHFVDLATEKQCKSMKFLILSISPHYKEPEIKICEGHFSVYSKHGKLHIAEPSICAIIYMPEKVVDGATSMKINYIPEMLYREHLVYQNIGKNTWIMNYIITPDLYSIENDIARVAEGDVQSKKFHFASDRVILDIPTLHSQDGWSVIPVSEKNYITQEEVNQFFMWNSELVAPVIKMLLHYEGGGEDLHVEVNVTGAKEDAGFFIQRFYDYD